MQSIFYSWPNIIGYIGVVLILYAYLKSHSGKMQVASFSYIYLNIAGSLMILTSLFYHPNAPALLIEIAWLAISIYGAIRLLASGNR